MHIVRAWPISLALLAGCASIRGSEPTSAGASAAVATQYWFRGTPRSTKPVLQGDVSLSMPLREGSVDFTTWGNMQLSNDTGDAVFPDGNGAEFTELDLVASYARTIEEYDVAAGVISYNFPNLVAESTHEAFVTVSREAWDLAHTLGVYFDFDVADDLYLSYKATKSMPLQDEWMLDLSGMIGLMGSDQAEIYFGEDDGGFSDLSATGTVSRAMDDVTTVFFSLGFVTVPDSGLRDALDDADLDDTGLWLTAGAAWSL